MSAEWRLNPLLVTHHSLRVSAVSLFNNSEEVKVSVPGGAGGSHENEFPCAAEEPGIGLDCIVASGAQKEPDAGKHEFTCSNGLRP